LRTDRRTGPRCRLRAGTAMSRCMKLSCEARCAMSPRRRVTSVRSLLPA
jgi:hypothetical protein